jgi:thioredoxin-like negative regulator of GroEL
MKAEGWEVVTLEFDHDDGREVATQYGVRGVPTTVIVEEGKDDIVQSGVLAESQLKELLGLS